MRLRPCLGYLRIVLLHARQQRGPLLLCGDLLFVPVLVGETVPSLDSPVLAFAL